MKLVLVIVAIAIVALSVYADQKWRRWMKDRRREYERENGREGGDDRGA